jgi:hypothetical protein
MRVTEASTRRVGRQCYHNMQDVQAAGYSITLQCGGVRLTTL